MALMILSGYRVLIDIRGGIPKRGEIWTLAGPASTQIKRVVGMPGETVEVSGGRVLIDGKPLSEPYLAAPITLTMPAVHLEADQNVRLGDDRDANADSHIWGPLHNSKLIGRAGHRFWPSNRIGPQP